MGYITDRTPKGHKLILPYRRDTDTEWTGNTGVIMASATGHLQAAIGKDNYDLPLPPGATAFNVLPKGTTKRPLLPVGGPCGAGLDVWFARGGGYAHPLNTESSHLIAKLVRQTIAPTAATIPPLGPTPCTKCEWSWAMAEGIFVRLGGLGNKLLPPRGLLD